jgi:hypothetical protein
MKLYTLSAFVLMGLGLFGTIGIWLTSGSVPDYVVERYTGLKLPNSYSIVSQGDTRGGMHGNGEWWIVIKVRTPVMTQWLDSQPLQWRCPMASRTRSIQYWDFLQVRTAGCGSIDSRR